MCDIEILIGSHVWSRQSDFRGIILIFSFPVNMTFENNNRYIKWLFSIGYFERYSNWKCDYLELVYKLRRVKGEANFISSGSKIVKRLRRRQYDPAIIERTIGLVLGPFTALYRSFLKRCTLTTRRLGLYDGPCLNLLRGDRVLISVPSDC